MFSFIHDREHNGNKKAIQINDGCVLLVTKYNVILPLNLKITNIMEKQI
jgi:hypothetical protein